MNNESISRGEFIRGLGMSSKALLAFYCLGAVSACSKDDETETTVIPISSGGNADTGVTGSATGATINFTLNLSNANLSKLLQADEFVIVGDILVANANGAYIALSKECTHQGTPVQFRKDQGDVWCPSHGSEFNTNGTVKKSPALKSLVAYKTEFNNTAKTLKVS